MKTPGMFVWLFRNHITSREKAHHRRTFTLLLLTAAMVTLIVFLLFLLINSVQLGFQDDLPKVHGKWILDELLQTNIGITQNLRAGIATLSPLVTSLIVSVLGINI